jgi:integrase
MPKRANNELSENTIIMDLSMIRRIKREFKDIKLKDLKADVIQEKLASMTQRRTAEGMFTVLKLALVKAKDRTGGRNIMENVEMIKHRRVGGRALSKDEIDTLLSATDNETEKDIIRVYVNTGCRVDELTRLYVKHVNFSNESRVMTDLKFHGKAVSDMEVKPNELFIYGTKTRLSIRTMPITPKLKPILERLIAGRDGEEQLFPKYHTHTIRNFHKEINARLLEKGTPIRYTLKDYRHTAATNFKDAGIPSSVYFSWFGWSDDTMAKRVYTHKTDFERNMSQEWASKFA